MREFVALLSSSTHGLRTRILPEFLALFFPQAHADINWSNEYEFLDKELQQVVRDAELGARRVDKLVKVWRTNGNETWVLVHVEVQETRRDEEARRYWKFVLVRRMYERGYSRTDIVELFRFIDWVMTLPEVLENELWQEIYDLEEERQMPYITSVERIGIQKGIEQGLQQGLQQGMLEDAREMVLEALSFKFGVVPVEVAEAIKSIQVREVGTLERSTLNVQTCQRSNDKPPF